MKIRKYIGFILLGIFCLTGCQSPEKVPRQAEAAMAEQPGQPRQDGSDSLQSLSLVYYNGESLNPLNCQSSTNFSMRFLWCDPIIGLDQRQKPVAALAAGWELKENKAVLTLRSGVLFHDGTTLGAGDVVNTLNYVMSEVTSPYHAIADGISSVKATGPLTVEITLKEADWGFFARLNVPVVKNPRDQFFPIGTGKYILRNEQNKVTLTANENWYGTDIPRIKTIKLRSFPDRAAINFAFSTGEVALLNKGMLPEGQEGYYGISEEYYYTSQNLVFLSVNTKNEKLTAPVRSCLNELIDRDKLTGGRIDPVTTPLYPNWWAVTPDEEEPAYITRTQREEKLKGLGFVDLDGNGVFDREDGSPLTPFVLLANGDNVEKSEIALKIADQLRIMGFPVTLETPGFGAYQERLLTGEFDLAIVEVALNSSMDISPLVAAEGINNYGAFAGIKTQLALTQMKTAKNEEEYSRQADHLRTALLEETPVIALFYRKGTVSVQKDIPCRPSPMVSDIYANIENW